MLIVYAFGYDEFPSLSLKGQGSGTDLMLSEKNQRDSFDKRKKNTTKQMKTPYIMF